MKNININAMYFSPTETTKKTVSFIGKKISEKQGDSASFKTIDFTLPEVRKEKPEFTKDDFLIIGVPVYAGRVPNVLLDYLNSIEGNGAYAAAVVLYGNRNFDDALIELRDILISNGFTIIAGGAFIVQHSFSRTLGDNRPDDSDMEMAAEFAEKIYCKLSQTNLKSIEVKGNKPYRPYYVVLDKTNKPVYDFKKIKPKTNEEECIDCKICVEACPMGSIDNDNVAVVPGICIKCCACIKKCPVNAKYFDDKDFIDHKKDLEKKYKKRREPEIFI
jgi:NAD-dependent dihydropyrimidine dehydrogenase PreA subunit/protein involved in ribonucleotide reduction